MSRGVNKAIIVGNLGNDPEIRKTQTGATVATISVATSESWTDKTSGEKQNKVEWHRVVAFNRLAEIIEQYLTCLLYTSPSPRDRTRSRMPSSA